ncbi:LamG domain-containing protein [Pontiella sulfatireligans]|uniref:LamG-like jellyroll fold domain-containing protein n=1 Tax=Pontiella sulfatireligans TaxID=2750658 RepID=A0A6C2UNF4_9BACT|nr:LamG domain-containing protein [Pontiella sulfatireligans]VGO20811.1 hypothetical protein SCARR_02878 [Pontiella sulfatireligans]
MKQNIILLSIGLSCGASTLLAASHGGYSMTAPAAFPIYNSSTSSTWSATNNRSAELMGSGSATCTNGALPQTAKYKLYESQIGCPIEHLKPEYYLADAVEPPQGTVDWKATQAALKNLVSYNSNATFIAESDGEQKLYFSEGGAIVIPWIFTDGTADTHTYQVADTSHSKPYRIFWTDAPYNSPAINLNGKFFQLFGSSSVLEPVVSTTTNYPGGAETVTETISRGLYFDQSTQLLNAVGGVEGRVVLAYYSTGAYSDCLGTIVLEVSEPDIETVTGEIGKQLLPTGDGYNTNDLVANVTAGLEGLDDIGAYAYQHSGDHSYSPKNNFVYAIRRSTGEGWKIEVYWEMTDFMGSDWPFEVLHYDCDWPEDAQRFVRGNVEGNYGMEVTIPDDYVVELQEYQEPSGCATVSDNTFYTDNEGYALLKLTGTDCNDDDNVWFIPVNSVWRDLPEFDLTPNVWPVGTEVTPLTTSVALEFEGDAYVDTGISNFYGSFTVEGWVNVSGKGSQRLAGSECVDDELLDFAIEYSNHQIIGSMGIGSAEDDCVTVESDRVELDEWNHIALVYDEATQAFGIYLNGECCECITNTSPRRHDASLHTVVIGADDTGSAYNGFWDDIRIWNTARAADQISDNMGGFLHEATDCSGLVAYYPVENSLGRLLQDHSGNEHHAAMVNAVRAEPGAVGLCDMDGFSAYYPYLYSPVSGDNYAQDLYTAPGDLVESNSVESIDLEDGSTGSGAESYIFGINDTKDADDSLEIWWAHAVEQDDMPEPVWFPAWVQKYAFAWPTAESHSTPEIALCSQLGSEGFSAYKTGVALDFSDSVDSYMSVPGGAWFAGGEYTVEFWIKPHSAEDNWGRIFSFFDSESEKTAGIQGIYRGDSNSSSRHFKFEIYTGDGVQYQLTTSRSIELSNWNHVALTYDEGKVRVYINGESDNTLSNVPLLSNTLGDCFFGKYNNDASSGSFDGQLDEFRIWSSARTQDEVRDTRFKALSGSESGLRLCYNFDDDIAGSSVASLAYDQVGGLQGIIHEANWILPGAPCIDDGILYTENDEEPEIYFQNDPDEPGYNPNEEHAFLLQDSYGGYVVHALRNDLNTDDSSEPYVIVQYSDPDDGHPSMQLYSVVRTNCFYSDFSDTMTFGTVVPGPHPLDYLENPWVLETYWETSGYEDASYCPGYKDRSGRVWAKNAGLLTMHNYYPMQESFYFPKMDPQPGLGEAVAWLGGGENDADPVAWDWTIDWLETSAKLDIGQTLTAAVDDLPDVWDAKSLTIVYQSDITNAPVVLFDPTQTRGVKLEVEGTFMDEYGFENGKTAYTKNGYSYFYGMPPTVGDRFYYDPYASDGKSLKLKGERVEHSGGLTYLQLNLLNAEEKETIKGLSTNELWIEAVENLPFGYLSTAVVTDYSSVADAYPDSPYDSSSTGSDEVTVMDSIAADHYALVNLGTATGRVVLVENDSRNENSGVNAGDIVTFHMIELTTNLYTGSILTVEDSNNLLSDQLDVVYTEAFAGTANDFEFEWRWHEPELDGTTSTNYAAYTLHKKEEGLTRFTVGGEDDTLSDMINKFFVARYRATTNSPVYGVAGDQWSDWIGPTLAEGWVERTLNNITPFTQRMQDLYNNAAESYVSMIQQAGGPYTIPVTLSQDNLDEIGLIELYETILDEAESKSLRLSTNNIAANQQLMLAATRLNDLYVLLGNEAYADAMDPTIGFGSDFVNSDGLAFGSVDYGAIYSSLFCFDNLVSNLRDEELALLRGRADSLAPNVQLSPTYNRLYWNFTKGETAGEVAYAVNYQIVGTDSAVIDAEQAAGFYPQGHGDAWGHYLSALYNYYRLMRNPYFSWGTPSISSLTVGDATVDVDYYDEEKFAETAAALVRTGIDIVKRTTEKTFVENDGEALYGYMDEDATRAFGYGEWGSRAGQMALYNWVAANSLLPEDPAVSTNYVDDGILRIDRSTAAGLEEIASAMKSLQRAVDEADAGMTPLGLSSGAIPFDIDPAELADGKSHFEQIYERAETALDNAEVLLDRAQGITRLLRQQNQSSYNLTQDLANEEAAFNQQLIAIYGYPFDDDIGAGGTYDEDYSGPDLYHYMWMDLEQYGLEEFEDDELEVVSYEVDGLSADEEHTYTFELAFNPNGIVQKPADITGTRRAQGSLQAAYGSFIEAVISLEHAEDEYEAEVEILELKANIASTKITTEIISALLELGTSTLELGGSGSEVDISTLRSLFSDADTASISMKEIVALGGSLSFSTGELLATSTEAQRLRDQATAKAVMEGFRQLAEFEYSTARKIDAEIANTAKVKTARKETHEKIVKILEYVTKLFKSVVEVAVEYKEEHLEVVEQCTKVEEHLATVESAYAKFVNAQEAFLTIQASGEALQSKRERLRKQAVNRIAAGRYQDMAFRTFRNEALAKYSNAFDLAKKYTYLAAKAYDYETALNLDDVYEPDSIFREIVGTRSLGHIGEDGIPQLGGLYGDGGLADILAQLQQNWLVLEPRLGINNAQIESKWTSLRQGCFRIPSGSDGKAAWADTLDSYVVDDLLEYDAFRSFCLPFNSTSGLEAQEPGLVIPFRTAINFAENVFGRPLASQDQAFNSSYYATRIYKVGVKITGYNMTVDGSDGVLSSEPQAYLIPVGLDMMRSPSSDGGNTFGYSVVDQVIPAPFSFSGENLDEQDWTSLYDNCLGNDEPMATIRRYPSMRVYTDQDSADLDMISNTRLVGRSVWNTRWLLIIPAGSLHADREYALDALIHGTKKSGSTSQIPITDIKIGFETYSTSGN